MAFQMSHLFLNRTSFAIRMLAVAVLCCAATMVQAQAQYQAGREYVQLAPPRPVATGSRIEVLEFFDRVKFTRRVGDAREVLRPAKDAFAPTGT